MKVTETIMKQKYDIDLLIKVFDDFLEYDKDCKKSIEFNLINTLLTILEELKKLKLEIEKLQDEDV